MPKVHSFRLLGSETAADAPPLGGKDVVVSTARRLVPGLSRAGGADEAELPADAVVRIELDNGFVLWSRADDLIRERGRRSTGRDGTERWEISMQPPAGSRARAASRGWLGLGVKILEFFGIDVRRSAVRALGGALELRQLHDGGPGLYRCPLDGRELRLAPLAGDERIAAGQGPVLLFIHGTGSSTAGSFGKLWHEDLPAARAARERLRQRYGDRVFALEHRSLTESPIANALALAERLEAGVELHLVTHSRGGLVGELLTLGMRERDDDPLGDALIEELFAADRTMAEQLGLGALDGEQAQQREQAYQADRALLARLRDELDARRVRVGRFVRVACPARGTTLASGRLDRWLSVLDFVAGSSIFGEAMDFLLAVVKERTDPRTLPGLEAMMPGSALTRLLNRPELVVAADLSVIAGDIEGDSLWGQIKLLITDWFYGADHDLVVNTGSMSGGLRRPPGQARLLCDRGAEVNHFNYFGNERSLQWLLAGLTRADDSDGGFRPIADADAEPPRWREALRRSRSASAPRPLAVVLPGIMGSTLQADGETVWLHYWRLARGGLKRIGYGRAGVEPVDLIGDFYGPLVEFLARSHRVEIFPYDWRHSVRDAAARLAGRLEELLPRAEQERQPVHLVAHSMGGLVVRSMIADGGPGSAVWQRIKALPNSRLLMLGTPNLGSYEAVRWLTGCNPTELKLALLDLTQSATGIVDIVRRYPGVLELLPFDPAGPDFSAAPLWKALKAELDGTWPLADDDALRDARSTWERLREAPPEPRHMIYVAGSQPSTVTGYRTTSDDDGLLGFGGRKMVFEATARGDGTVTWASGLLPGVPTWYVEDTGHDALCAQRKAFAGYLELLAGGTTSRLPAAPPAGSRAAGLPERFVLPEQPFADRIPDAGDVQRLGFGGSLPAEFGDRQESAPMISVSVRHGDLAYARHPVLVGHYSGDTIVSAEAALNRHLQGALGRRLNLGLYPDGLGSHALFFHEHPDGKPAGAVVVGLGRVGELSPGRLQVGVGRAILDYALNVAQWPDEQRFGPADSVRSAALSCLLVGSGAGGIPVAASIEAILRGALQAADQIAASGLDKRVTVDRIEFVELFEDLAIAAAQALAGVLADGELARRISWSARSIGDGEGGQRRVRFEEAPEWWHRLEIIEDPARSALRFVFSTDRARAEQTLVAGQLTLADAFIARASASPASNVEVSRTLYEMLLPNALKELAPRQANLVVLVDKASARYPWELLEDRWSPTGRPQVTEAGFVRQLKTPRYRAHPAHSVEAKALVVGNPDLAGSSDFADLPGARQEAQRVAAQLRDAGFEVRESIDETAEAILAGLHRDAWRILHLAGHGVHEYPLGKAAAAAPGNGEGGKIVSGMVIGAGTVLTPGDVEQMRWVPELVFINCCHLARSTSRRPPQFAELAANLAIQFVDMGVRAVVAAGWAVDDGAAEIFAAGFYTRMLAGESFGDALRAARDETWVRCPGINTWGAYQCYGDPSYRLRGHTAAGGRRRAAPFFAPAELEAELHNLRESIRVTDTRDHERLRKAAGEDIEAALARIPQHLRDDWLGRAEIAAGIGFAWGEIGAWAEAIEWLEKAIVSAAGDCPVRAVEQCANFQVRLAGERWGRLRAASPIDDAARAELLARVEAAIAELEQINRRAPSSERYSLLGGACKRLAWLQTELPARVQALCDMADYYEQATRCDLAAGRGPQPYPVLNAAVARILAARLGDKELGPLREALLEQAEAMGAAASRRNEADPNIWDALGIGDAQLLSLLLAPPRGRALQAAADRVRASYGEALRRGASPRERASLLEQLEFVIEMSGGSHRLRSALESIRSGV